MDPIHVTQLLDPQRMSPSSRSLCWLGTVTAEARKQSQVSPRLGEGCLSVWLTGVAKRGAPLRVRDTAVLLLARQRIATAAEQSSRPAGGLASDLFTQAFNQKNDSQSPGATPDPDGTVLLGADSYLLITAVCLVPLPEATAF